MGLSILTRKKYAHGDIEQHIKDFAGEYSCRDITDEDLDKDLEHDLDFDSLDAIEFIMSIEDFFNIEIPDDLMEKTRTIRGYIDLTISEVGN